MKVGRNHPCPCGSGLKFKFCCGLPPVQGKTDILRLRYLAATRSLVEDLLAFASKHYPADSFASAWAEFSDGEGIAPDEDSLELSLFMPWYLYRWLPEPVERGVTPGPLQGVPIARAYASARYARRAPTGPELLRSRYLERCSKSGFSFMDVLSTTPGQNMVVRDLLTDAQLVVFDATASESIEAGDTLLGWVVQFSDITMLDTVGQIGLGTRDRAEVIELRHRFSPRRGRMTPASVRTHQLDIAWLYLDLIEERLDPALPILRNLDGDDLEFHQMVYRTQSAVAAFEALASLCIDSTPEQLMRHAELRADGTLHKVDFSWLRQDQSSPMSGGSTVLASLRIVGSSMTVECNSSQRADQIRRIIADRLAGAVLESTETTPATELLLRAGEHRPEDREYGASPGHDDDLAEDPAVRALLDQQMGNHYRAWVDMKLPALGGETPREAVLTRKGRDLVEGLVRDIARPSAPLGPGPEVIAELCTTLGLPPPLGGNRRR